MRLRTGDPPDRIPPASGTRLRGIVQDEVVRQVAHTFGTKVLLVVVGLATSVLVSRALGPEGRGVYIVAITIGAVGVQLGNLGLQTANTYFVAKERSVLGSLIGNSLVVGLGGGLFAALLLSCLFALWPGIAPIHPPLVFAAVAWIPFGLASLFLQNILIGLDRIRITNRIDAATRVLGVALLVGVIVGGWVSVESMFAVAMLALLVTLAWTWLRLRPLVSEGLGASWSLFVRTLRYGAKAYTAALFAFLVIRSDLFIVQYLRGAEDTGQYSIAVTLGDFVYLFPMVVATVVFPRLSAIDRAGEKWRLAARSTLAVAGVLVVGGAVAAVLAGPGIRLLYGEAFAPAAPLFLWLLPGIILLGVETVLVQYLNSEGFPMSVVWGWGGAFVLNLVLNLVFVPRYGATGAAVASSICYGLMFLFIVVVTIGHLRRALHPA